MSDFEPPPSSFFGFMVYALGMKYAILIPMSGLASFIAAMFLVIRGRGPFVVAALILVVHMPLLVSLYAVLDANLAAYQVFASSTAEPKQAEISQCVSIAMFALFVGMMSLAPGYLVGMIGTIVRSLTFAEPTVPRQTTLLPPAKPG